MVAAKKSPSSSEYYFANIEPILSYASFTLEKNRYHFCVENQTDKWNRKWDFSTIKITQLPDYSRHWVAIGKKPAFRVVTAGYFATNLVVSQILCQNVLAFMFIWRCNRYIFVYIKASLGVIFEIHNASNHWKRKIGTNSKGEFLFSFQWSQVLFISNSTTSDAILD